MQAIAEMLAAGMDHHRAGRLAEAEQTYRGVLEADAACADAWNLLGVLAVQTGQNHYAVPLIERAVELRPDWAEFQYSLGVAWHGQERLAEAEAGYRQALALDPNHARALNNLGNLLAEQGKIEEAIDCHRRARDLNPGSADAHFNLGNNLKAAEAWDEAIACYQRALELRPAWAEALSNWGDTLQGRGDAAAAIGCYRRALELMPESPQIWSNLGTAMASQGDVEEAIGYFRLAAARMPELEMAQVNLGSALQKIGRLEEAVGPLREALRLNPQSAPAINALGLVLRDEGHFEEAMGCFRQSLAIDPDFSAAHMNHAMMLLSEGRFEEGWREYEWRWKTCDLHLRRFDKPQWDGGPIAGQTILLHAEQGLGDTLQFVRYAAMVKALGASVILECPKVLALLLKNCPGIDRVIAQGDELPAHDVHSPLLSLPRVFRTTLETVPADGPYLFADAGLVAEWRQRLEHLKGFRIGINWRGRAGQGVFRQRDIPLECFAALADDDVDLISLQKGAEPEELAAAIGRPVYHPGDDFDQSRGAFMDTAAIIMNLDLVVTSDTSLPHLAGALGAPAWIAVPYVASWQWMCARADSPWYSKARLFRQQAAGDWQGVFQAIRGALTDRVSRLPSYPHSYDA